MKAAKAQFTPPFVGCLPYIFPIGIRVYKGAPYSRAPNDPEAHMENHSPRDRGRREDLFHAAERPYVSDHHTHR